MFDIYYSKRILEQLVSIHANCKLSDAFKNFEINMETNPFTVEYIELDLPHNIILPMEIRGQYRYIKLVENVRILYHICEIDSSVEICMIEIDE